MAISSALSKPTSNADQAGIWPLRLFGLVFALAGIGFFIPVFGLPALHVLAAQNWHAVPCAVLESEVVSHSGNHGEQYNIGIKFAYNFGATRYIGTRYDFSIGTSNIYGYRRDIVDRLPAGRKTICYVNPENPSQAVINRGLGNDAWFVFLPLSFLAVGLGVMFGAPRMARAHRVNPMPLPKAGGKLRRAAGDEQPPLTKFLVSGFCALLLNGISFSLAYEAYFANESGVEGWVLKVISIPFLLIGFASIAGSLYFFLALFNPRPQMKLSRAELSLGESSEVRWSFSGNYSSLRRLTIFVEGCEKASYPVTRQSAADARRGPRNDTDTSVFARICVVDTARQADIGSGRVKFTIPADTMHTFFSVHNSIMWSVVLHGEIPRWPDVKSRISITVGPLAIPHSVAKEPR